jgi:cephalosporin-C deacetylase-like acetyl esterase
MPSGEGPFPGVLVLPGFGCAALPIPAEQARHGYAALMLQIHGMDVDQETYVSLRGRKYGQGPRGGGLKDDYYYYVYLACVQAVEYLAAHPAVDAGRLGVAGGSQGGLLAIVTAGLSPRIGAAASALCFYADHPYRDWVKTLNDEKADGMHRVVPPFDRDDSRQNHMSYYDPVNFATRVKAPTIMGACLSDHPSPITTVHAVYRKLAAPLKEIHYSVGTNHDLMFAFERAAYRWIDEHLK